MELNAISADDAVSAIMSRLAASGFQIVRKDRFDAMHRRAQVAEGLLSAITHDLEMWNRCLQDKSNWLDTWLFRNALGRFSRLSDRAHTKAESAAAGFHILSDADLQAAVGALEAALPYVARYESENMSNVALDVLTKGHAAIRAMQGGKP